MTLKSKYLTIFTLIFRFFNAKTVGKRPIKNKKKKKNYNSKHMGKKSNFFTISFIHEKRNDTPIDQKYIMQHDFSTSFLCLYCPLFASHNYANH